MSKMGRVGEALGVGCRMVGRGRFGSGWCRAGGVEQGYRRRRSVRNQRR